MKIKPGNIFILLIFLIFSLRITAQDRTIDFLKLALANAKHDTTKLIVLVKLSEICDLEEILHYAEPAAKLAETKIKNIRNNTPLYSFYAKLLSGAYNNIGYSYDERGEIERALFYYIKSLKIDEGLKNKSGMAGSLNNISLIYKEQGDVPAALKCYHQSLKLYEELNDNSGIATSLNNIGLIFQDQGDLTKALDYFNKSLKHREAAANDKFGIANSLNNIGGVYVENKNFLMAIAYHLKSLKIKHEINDEEGIATSYNNLGAVYKLMLFDKQYKSDSQKDSLYKTALDYYYKSLNIYKEIKNKRGVAYSLTNISSLLIEKGDLQGALFLGLQSFNLAQELGFPANIGRSAGILKKIYQQQNNSKKAFEMYSLFIQMNDSVNNEKNKKESVKKQFQYQYEKKAAADSVKNAEEQKVKNAQLTAQKAQLSQEKTQRIALYGGLFLITLFLGFVFNRFKILQRQKTIISKQKELVDTAYEKLHEKNKEIMDSIYYARRIQNALLTPENYFTKQLNRLTKK